MSNLDARMAPIAPPEPLSATESVVLLTTQDPHGPFPTAEDIDVLITEADAMQIVINDELVELVGLMNGGNFKAHVDAICLVHSLPVTRQAVTDAELQTALIHRALKKFVNQKFIEAAFGPHVRKQDKVEIEEACEKMFKEKCTQALKTAVIQAFAKSGRTIQRSRPEDIRRKEHSKRRPPRRKKIGNPTHKDGVPRFVEIPVHLQAWLSVIPKGTESTDFSLFFANGIATIVPSDSEARND